MGSNLPCASLDVLTRTYGKKYREKTGKGYTEVKMTIGNGVHQHIEVKLEKLTDNQKQVLPGSKLDPSL